jgi:hypothetical protein
MKSITHNQNLKIMKQFAFLLGIFLFGAMAHAQQGTQKSDDMNTLFGKDGETSVGWMIGVKSGYTQFDSRDVWTGGISGGMVIGHQFTIGLTGNGWVNRENMYFQDVTDTTGAYLEGGYGGLLLEYTLFPKSAVHLTFPIMIGGGGATYVSGESYTIWDEDEWDTDYDVLDTDVFFTIEPGVMLEVNLLKFMRLDAGVTYRYTSGFDMINTNDNLLNNFNAMVGLKFGKF